MAVPRVDDKVRETLFTVPAESQWAGLDLDRVRHRRVIAE